MKREHLEHILRSAGSITGLDKFIIIGSQAILASIKNPPSELTASMEADIFALDDLNASDLVDGAIGENSIFHETFGYYAHGTGKETAVLGVNWEKRLKIIKNKNTKGISGLCLHPIDIAASKLIAGRPKDIDYVKNMLKYKIIFLKDLKKVSIEFSGKSKDILENALKLL